MKKIILIMTVLVMAQTTNLMAQTTDIESLTFRAILQEVLNLTITSDPLVIADFDTPDEYNLGIDAVNTTTITVEATGDWDLQITAPDLLDISGTGFIIPINNVGVWCESPGNNKIGAEVSCPATSLPTCMGLLDGNQTLLDLGTGSNAGGALDNMFNLNWTMGSMQNASMAGTSILEQLTATTIGGLGTYETTIVLTLTAKP